MAENKEDIDNKIEERTKLEQQLGQVSYQLSKQAEIVNEANKVLRSIQTRGNELVTEIEKLDGK